ncbi:MAG: uroporphyrinogen-III C-methyltransferase [Planctomycetaceae bacterium]|nr:uroporphyrinogen-III C-methyltransferase [Planctomycetaceae bacterium]
MLPLGTVYLVGAGPGDPGLLTLRGRECLARADLVLYDGLVHPLVLRHARGIAQRTARAAGPGGLRLDQAEINRQLIDAARRGLTVVRLKGGDPLIFGRGSEEAHALAEAGVPFEIVPGVTAATAAGAYSGISFTQRDTSSAVAFVTGHEDPGKPASLLDYDALARFPGTLVFYMGLHRVAAIADALIAAGKPPSTPAAVVSRAATPLQRTVVSTLDNLGNDVASAGLQPPSLVIVGDCVTRREQIAWFEKRPLLGQRIGIPRPEGQADPVIECCFELGAEPVLMPLIRILPPADWTAVDAVLQRLHEFDWLVFTSVNGVEQFFGRLWAQGGDARNVGRLKLAAIGTATSEALARRQLRADVVPESFRAEELGAKLGPLVQGQRVLWARASRGRDVLPTLLREAGATMEEVVVYQNIDADALPEPAAALLEAGQLDWIGLSSPSMATRLATLLGPAARAALGRTTRLAAISPVTAEAAAAAGLPVAAVADVFTWQGLLDAIVAARRG